MKAFKFKDSDTIYQAIKTQGRKVTGLGPDGERVCVPIADIAPVKILGQEQIDKIMEGPKPWTMTEDCSQEYWFGSEHYLVIDDQYTVAICDEEEEAQRIVHCVNCHDELLELVRQQQAALRQYIATKDPDDGYFVRPGGVSEISQISELDDRATAMLGEKE